MEGNKEIFNKLKDISHTQINEEIIKQVELAIPLLTCITQEDKKTPAYQKLIALIVEMANYSYNKSTKYENMYKVIEIGNMLELLLPEKIQLQVDATTIKGISETQDFKTLEFIQQWSIFKIARNMSADGFHNLYENQTEIFLQGFCNLCKGANTAKLFADEHTFYNSLKKNIEKKSIFSMSEESHDSLDKLFHLIAYFLNKAKQLMHLGNYKGAYMALIAAGNCARDFNRSRLNEVKKDSIMQILTNIRLATAHSYTKDHNENSLLLKLANEASDESINKYIEDLANEVIRYKVKIDPSLYKEDKEKKIEKEQKTSPEASESPRPYRRNVLDGLRKEALSKESTPITTPTKEVEVKKEESVTSYRGGGGRGTSESPGRGKFKPEKSESNESYRGRGASLSRGRGRGRGRGDFKEDEISSIPTSSEKLRSTSEEKVKKELPPKIFSSHEEHKHKPFKRDDQDKGGGRGYSSKDVRPSAPINSGNLSSGSKDTRNSSQKEGAKTGEQKSSTHQNLSKTQEQEIKAVSISDTYNKSTSKSMVWESRRNESQNVSSEPLSIKDTQETLSAQPQIKLKSLIKKDRPEDSQKKSTTEHKKQVEDKQEIIQSFQHK